MFPCRKICVQFDKNEIKVSRRIVLSPAVSPILAAQGILFYGSLYYALCMRNKKIMCIYRGYNFNHEHMAKCQFMCKRQCATYNLRFRNTCFFSVGFGYEQPKNILHRQIFFSTSKTNLLLVLRDKL